VNIVPEYIKYQWNARGRHGAHSPFLYDLVDVCLRIPLDKEDLAITQGLVHCLKSDNRSIQIIDAGAGSRKLGAERKVTSILAVSSSKGKYAKLLYRLARHYQPKRILEFGTSLGVGTVHLSLASPKADIVTVEACPETQKIAKEQFDRLNMNNISPILSTFQQFIESYQGELFDMVFVDGHHDGKALLNYMNQLKAITHNDTIFVLDDIRWSDSMKEAFDTIVDSSNFHVSMDLFRVGIVVPRQQQDKEHFVVRY
jgi:predicted O-methyltransferase YrrM